MCSAGKDRIEIFKTTECEFRILRREFGFKQGKMESVVDVRTLDEEKRESLCRRVINWWMFCRLLLTIPNSHIKAMREKYIKKEELYNLMYGLWTQTPERFNSLLQRYQADLGPGILAAALSPCPTELDINKAIYEIIRCVPLEERPNFVLSELGTRMPERRQLEFDAPYELRKCMLLMWWEEANHEPGSLNALMEEAEAQGYLKPEKEILRVDYMFQNVKNTTVKIYRS